MVRTGSHTQNPELGTRNQERGVSASERLPRNRLFDSCFRRFRQEARLDRHRKIATV